MLATRASPSQLQVTQRVFLEPQQQVRLGLQHVTFSIDWVHVAGCAAEPLQAGCECSNPNPNPNPNPT